MMITLQHGASSRLISREVLPRIGEGVWLDGVLLHVLDVQHHADAPPPDPSAVIVVPPCATVVLG